MATNNAQAFRGGEVLKADIINLAYSHLRISGLTRDPTAEDLELALVMLETIAGEFFTRNMDGGYNFQHDPDPADLSGVPTPYKSAYAYALALRLAADFGKELSPSLVMAANAAVSNMAAREALTREVSYPARQARGSGNTQKFYRWRRFYQPDNSAPTEDATNILYVDDINDYVEHFDSYLRDGEVIDTYTIDEDTGLAVSNDANATPDITYTIKADGAREGSLRVKIVITTDQGRQTTRVVYFDVRKIEGL